MDLHDAEGKSLVEDLLFIVRPMRKRRIKGS